MKTRALLFVSFIVFGIHSSFAGDLNQLNSRITFCDEPMPIQNKRVARFLESAIINVAEQPLYKLRPRIRQTFGIIKPILDKYQIPVDLMYLTVVESGLSSDATSHKGAKGYWQFMPETATGLGLSVNEKNDERLNLKKSTEAACKYFQQMYQEFGSWTLVAAAFNVGPTRVKNHIAYTGSKNYYNWNLNKENRDYVYRIIAVKEMLTRPQAYQAMIEDSIDLQSHLKRDGLVLGLVSSPFALQLQDSAVVGFSFLNESVISGFQNMVSSTFKKCSTTLFDRVHAIKSQISTVDLNLAATFKKSQSTISDSETPIFYRREELLATTSHDGIQRRKRFGEII